MSAAVKVIEAMQTHQPSHRTYHPGAWWELSCSGCDVFEGKRLSHLDWAPHRAHLLDVVENVLSEHESCCCGVCGL